MRYKSQFRYGHRNGTDERYKGPESSEHINIDDMLADAELSSIAVAKVVISEKRECCDCPETLIRKKRVALHRPGDCEYSKQRSALVLKAVRRANKRVAARAQSGEGSHHAAKGNNQWVRVFADEMESLSKTLLNGAHTEAMSIDRRVQM